MQIFASLLRSCLLLALSTGSLGQSVPASALEELRIEFHEMNEVLRNENALKFEEVKNELQNKNEALRHELENKTEMFRVELAEVKNKLEDVRAVLQTQPRRTNEDFSCMSQDEDSGDIYFDGCNVHVRSGGGSTDAPTNGKGNLIIGYNEPRDSLMEVPESAEGPKKVDGLEDTEAKKDVSGSRGGSHNLIIGDLHEYTSYGGIVTGVSNRISNIYSAVVGGYNNAATGKYSTVTGGLANGATGYASSISGGRDNTSSGAFSSVLGGSSNVAQGDEAVVTGGIKNKAIGDLASVVGGKKNRAKKRLSVVTGA